MKNLKTKIGLSVLALACLGAGALNLQPNVSAKAEETTETVTTLENSRLRTYYGAEICVDDDFSGIRWKSRTPKGFPYVDADGNFMNVQGATETNGAIATNGVGAQFGVLVAPTGSFGDELTIADVSEDGAMNLAYAEGALDTSEGATYFYTVINYEDLGSEFKQEAYALNLTARAYMLFNGQYYYALQEDNSRSARQIAVTNEVNGTLDKYRESEDADKVAFAAKATEYYGGGVATYDKDTSKHFIDDTVTTVVDMEAFATNGSVDVTLDLGEANFVEAVVGTEKVNATYADGKLTITDFGSVADGEHYVTVFTSNGFIYKPMITATKVFDEANDLAMFQTKGKVTAWSKISGWAKDEAGNPIADASQIYKGYYVLKNNINATDYVHGSRLEDGSGFNTNTWNGFANYKGKDFGLMGTFNGMGYTIDGLTQGSAREGIFGVVNGGAVKNVGFTNYKTATMSKNTIDGAYTNVIANYLYNATVDNVYISTAEDFLFGTGTGLIASTAYGETVISNCYINVNTSSTNAAAAVFGSYHKDQAYTCENVYVNVVTTQASSYIVATVDGETTTYASGTLEIFPMGLSQAKAKNGAVTTKGTVYFAQNQTAPTELTATAYSIERIDGVYAYASTETWGTHEYDNFLATGCWTASDRGVAWVVKGAQE